MQELETNPEINSSEKAKKAMANKNIDLGEWGKDNLEKTKFSKEKEIYNLVGFTVKQLGFSRRATTDEIYQKAQELRLELCPAEVGPHLRLQYSGKEWMFIAMEQIIALDGYSPSVFDLNAIGEKLALDGHDADPKSSWDSDRKFIFLFRKLNN